MQNYIIVVYFFGFFSTAGNWTNDNTFINLYLILEYSYQNQEANQDQVPSACV